MENGELVSLKHCHGFSAPEASSSTVEPNFLIRRCPSKHHQNLPANIAHVTVASQVTRSPES